MPERSNRVSELTWGGGPKGVAKLPVSLPEPVSLKWDFVHIPLIPLTACPTVVPYARMSEQIPNNADFAGSVNGYMAKSPLAVMWPVFTQLMMAAVMTAVRRRYDEAAVQEAGHDDGLSSDKQNTVFWNSDDPRIFIPSGSACRGISILSDAPAGQSSPSPPC